ncbi:MAG: Nicotinate-nucleotide adenylyltransferase [Chlamydiales bacterium]|nr:Nicotinate-nucleotide adenylyltransferase [Chlamydiales bacterium]
MKKIGLFGGTFNPVHFGHLNLAFELMEKGGLDEVWWIPASRSPLRQMGESPTPEQRLKMVALAVEEIPQFKVLDLEIRRPSPSYTIETVDAIVEANPGIDFSFLLSQDVLARFMEWKKPLELVKRIPLLIGQREGEAFPVFPEEIQRAVQKGLVKSTQLDISATQVRDRIKKRLYVGHLIPAKVLDFIYVNQLYFTV